MHYRLRPIKVVQWRGIVNFTRMDGFYKHNNAMSPSQNINFTFKQIAEGTYISHNGNQPLAKLHLGLAAIDIGVCVSLHHCRADPKGGGVDCLHKNTVGAGDAL